VVKVDPLPPPIGRRFVARFFRARVEEAEVRRLETMVQREKPLLNLGTTVSSGQRLLRQVDGVVLGNR